MPQTTIAIAAAIQERYPDFGVCAVSARALETRGHEGVVIQLLQDHQRWQREHFAYQSVSEHPHIAAWRTVYSSFGAKPSKYQSSVEALLRRVLKDEELPSISPLVDLYNAISVRHLVPAGGEDRCLLRGVPTLQFVDSESSQVHDSELGAPCAGEVVWRDAEGVTCRRWNWRQTARTRLRAETVDALFVLERMPPCPVETILEAADELTRILVELGARVDVQRQLHGACFDEGCMVGQ
jgi:DNA/RNA-binding domain of Phe-tRNA-synthetase-like protein